MERTDGQGTTYVKCKTHDCLFNFQDVTCPERDWSNPVAEVLESVAAATYRVRCEDGHERAVNG